MIELINQGVNPYSLDCYGNNVAHYLASHGRYCLLEVLCAIDIKLMKECNVIGESTLDVALECKNFQCASILVANGYRLHFARIS